MVDMDNVRPKAADGGEREKGERITATGNGTDNLGAGRRERAAGGKGNHRLWPQRSGLAQLGRPRPLSRIAQAVRRAANKAGPSGKPSFTARVLRREYR